MNPIMLANKISGIKGIINTVKGAKDPMAVMQNNPQMKEVMDMVRGKNPEEVFYAKCSEMGIDPEVILGMLR